MKGVAFWFFVSGVIYVAGGMLLGIEMGIRQDFVLAPVHAHLNLAGWATMALFGIFYHLMPDLAGTRLAWVHFGVATLGLWLLAAGIALSIRQHIEGPVIAGSLLTLTSMLIFLVMVLRGRAA